MKRKHVALLTVAAITFTASAQPAEGLVKNPRFTGHSADHKSPAHYTLTGDAAWAYCGWGNEFSDWGVALRSGEPNPPAPFPRREGGENSRKTSENPPPSLLGKGAGGLGFSGAVSQDVTGFEAGVGKWYRFSIRGMAEKNFAVAENGLFLKVDFFANKGANPLDGVTREIDALVAHDRTELATNGVRKRDGGAVWKTYAFDFRLPFAEIDQLRLTAGFRGGSATTEKESAFFVTEFALTPIPAPADAAKPVKTAKGYEPSLKSLIPLGGRWYYDPEPGMTGKPAKLVINQANAARLYYMDGRLTNPFAENMTAWLRKGYKDLDGKVVEKDRFVPDNVVIEFNDDKMMTVHARNLPNHPTAQFPGRNPNFIREFNAAYRIPLDPKPNPKAVAMDATNSNRGLPMGPIGIAINGVVFFNAFDAGMEDTTDMMDRCCGHPAPDDMYHYHKYPVCIKSPFVDEGEEHSPVIGWAFDGYPIYGPYESKRLMAKDDTARPLNAFNMHFDEERGWHYHVTPGKFPYIIGGYYGEVDRRNSRRGLRAGRDDE